MYGRIKEEKLRSHQLDFSVANIRNELDGFIDAENKRVNIDSAKKRAVMQGMDYDGFRQMVLGAHLFKISSKELINLNADRGTKKSSGEIVLNSALTTFNNVVDLSMRKREEIEAINMRIAQMLANNELQANNFREFKKTFDEHYAEPTNDVAAQNIFLILKSQKEENIKKIFSLDFDASYFAKILRIMSYITSNSLVINKNGNGLLFLMQFLLAPTHIKDFKMVIPKFLSMKERKEVASLLDLWSSTVEEFAIEQVINKDQPQTNAASEVAQLKEAKSNIDAASGESEQNDVHALLIDEEMINNLREALTLLSTYYKK